MDAECPPGLDANLKLKFLTSGGRLNTEWMDFDQKRYYTNAFIVQNNKLLLGYKKRGFGKHKFNGFGRISIAALHFDVHHDPGGKVEQNETPLEAAKRELEEEAGIQAPLRYAGTLLFLTKGDEWAFHIEIYRADTYTGSITETDEMRPQWFTLPGTSSLSTNEELGTLLADVLPFSEMWDTDRYWLPLLLANKPFVGRADFDKEGDVYRPCKWWFGELSQG